MINNDYLDNEGVIFEITHQHTNGEMGRCCYFGSKDLLSYYDRFGEHHRLDGPARIKGEIPEFWIHGKSYNEKEYWLVVNRPHLLAFL